MIVVTYFFKGGRGKNTRVLEQAVRKGILDESWAAWATKHMTFHGQSFLKSFTIISKKLAIVIIPEAERPNFEWSG